MKEEGDLSDYFLGLDASRCEAGGKSFEVIYDEDFYDAELGGAIFGDNVPVITAQAKDVKDLKRGDELTLSLWTGDEVFRLLDAPRRDGAGLARIPLKR